ncbi:MAG: phosphotransferase [Steroidobacteraceae bacterium]
MAASLPPAERLSAPPDWALARVPGLEPGAAPVVPVRLAGGSVNQVFRVDTPAGAFVLRLNGAAWRRPGVDRKRELALHSAAATAGVAPPIVAADPERDGLLITRFELGRLWQETDYADAAALHRLGERLQVLHALAPPAVAAFEPWSIAQDYLGQIRSRGPAQAPTAEALAPLQRACHAIHASARTECIAHGDLAHSNLLEGRRLWLLDWEYAQRSDALMDVACVLAYYPGARRYSAELAAASGLAIHSADDKRALAERVYVYRALSWLWHLARDEPATAPAGDW